MSEHVVYGTHVKDVADQERLEHAFKLTKEKGNVFYVLPSQMWLQEARRKRPGLLITTFDDIASFILNQTNISYISLSEEERTLFFLQFVRDEVTFRGEEVVSGKARAYADTYGQLKRLGLNVTDIPQSLMPISDLFQRYEDRVVLDRTMFDPENIILHAIKQLKKVPNQIEISSIVIDGYYDFSPLQMLFIEALKLAGISVTVFVPNHPHFHIVEQTVKELLSIGFIDKRVSREETTVNIEQRKLIAASTNEEQWRGVMEEIRSSDLAYDQMGILVVDERNGMNEVTKYTDMYDVPLNKAKKRKLSTTSSHAFMQTALKNTTVPTSKWEQLPLVEQVLRLYQVSGLEFAKQKQTFLQTGEWFKKEHQELFEATSQLQWKKSERFIDYINQLRNVIDGLPFFTYWEEQFSLMEDVSKLKEIAGEYKALKKLAEHLYQYELLLHDKGLESLMMTHDLFVEWIHKLGESLQLFEERAAKRGISIYTWRDVSLFRGEKLFVVGMNEGSFPAPHHLSGYVHERDLLGSAVRFSPPTAEHFRLKQQAYFEQLRYVAKSISFTYVKGIDANHPLLPSTLLEGIEESHNWTWENRMGSEYAFTFEDQIEKIAYHVGKGCLVEGIPDEVKEITKRLSRLEKGHEPISLYQGQSVKPVVSVTALESYARCPFRYGMERVLQVPEPQAIQEQVSPLDIGDLMHSIIEEIYKELKAVGQSFAALREGISHIPERIDELFEEKWEQIEKQSPEISRFDLQITKQQWQKRLRRWWQAERKHFFDNADLEQMQIMAIEKPIRFELPLSNDKTLVLTGKADRIDRLNNAIVVYDYKSGQASVKMEDVQSGLKLQLPLYAFAIREEIERLEEKVVQADGATYISLKEPSKRAGNGMWRTEHVGKSSRYNVSSFCRNREDELGTEQFLIDHQLKERITEIWEGMQTNFPVEPLECSTFCSYRTVCRVTDEKREQAKR
ncbi:PD-(D/E)XK nuclease family protein [Halalkalibacter flavus]|uniref:PD-(D/E)XK nuclease family protein n=1 Tax=Halalkalibacter flavus TaxID=3090668 RepID=UPI002FC63B75